MPAKNPLLMVISILFFALLFSCALCADSTASRPPNSTPQRLRAEALTKLKVLAPSLSDELGVTVNGAIQKIETTPDPNRGGMSSDAVTESVRLLMKAIPDAPQPEVKNELQYAIVLLVTAEGLAAQAAFREADAAAGLDLEFVAHAQDNLNEARVAFLNGEFDQAVRHYVLAYEAVRRPRGGGAAGEPDLNEEEPADVLTRKVRPSV